MICSHQQSENEDLPLYEDINSPLLPEVPQNPVPIRDEIMEIIEDPNIPENTRNIVEKISNAIRNSDKIKTNEIRIDVDSLKNESIISYEFNENSNNYINYKLSEIPEKSLITNEFPISSQYSKEKEYQSNSILTTKDDMLSYTNDIVKAEKLSDFQNAIIGSYLDEGNNNSRLHVRDNKKAAQIIKERQLNRFKFNS